MTTPENHAQWRDLYRVGAYAMIAVTLVVILAIIAFFIWPYVPGRVPVEEIYGLLNEGVIGAVALLDTALLIGMLGQIPLFVALYVSLRERNPSYALLGLVLGLMGVAAVLPTRPVLEVMRMAEAYQTATDPALSAQYLAAGEALLSVFHGTAWAINIVLVAIGNLLLYGLMLGSPHYRRVTAWLGLATSAASLGFALPVVSGLFLLVSTFGGVALAVPLCMDLFRLARVE